MKKTFSFFGLLAAFAVSAQNVGIGTNAPGFRLDVVGRIRIQAATLGNPNTGSGIWFTDHRDNSNIVFVGMADSVNYGLWSQRAGIGWQMYWDARYGSMGLGATPKNSNERLLLDHPTGASVGIYNNGELALRASGASRNGEISFYSNGAFEGSIGASDSTFEISGKRSSLFGSDYSDIIFWPPPTCSGTFCFTSFPGSIGMYTNKPNSRVHIVAGTGSSGVLIGASASTSATGYMLNVAGKVICEELKVQLNTAWPDYVFESDYQMPSLESLEQQVMKQKHLPGIPSASQVNADSGIELGITQAKLLEKVEELYRYVFDLNKKLLDLKGENLLLKRKLLGAD